MDHDAEHYTGVPPPGKLISLDYWRKGDDPSLPFLVVLVTDQQEVYQDTNVNELLKTCATQLDDRIISYEGNLRW